MGPIIARASYFLLMILLAYTLKKIGILRREDGVALSRVVLNVTLPCAIIIGFRTFVFEWSYMIIPLISLASNAFMVFLGYMMTAKSSKEERVFYMLGLSAYNIGNFTLPFISGMLGASGVVAACLFDLGNSPMCLGLNFAFTAMAIGAAKGNPARQVLIAFTKPAFITYLVMIALSVLKLSLPEPIMEFAGMISAANAPMAMIMIGLMLEFRFDRLKLKEALTVNLLRLALASAIAFLFFAFAPFDHEVRKAVAITAFAPISSSAPAFIAELKGDVPLIGFASTLSIISSLIIIPLLVVLL